MTINIKNNISIFFVLLILFFFFSPAFLSAQTVQMTWTGGENALRYEVIIEAERETEFIVHTQESVTENGFSIRLPPGNYRYKVIAYDLLDRPASESHWKFFEVRVRESGLYSEHSPPVTSEQEFELEIHEEEARERKPRNYFFNIGVAYMPYIPVFGNDKKAEIAGAAVRASINFPLNTGLYLGPELLFSWRDGITTLGLNARLYKELNNKKLGFVYRLGAEHVFAIDYGKYGNYFNVTTGVSFIYSINMINLEAGFDFASSFNFPPNGSIKPYLGVGIRF